MPNKKQDKPPGNIYDRIFRENAEQLFIPLIKKLLNLNIKSYKALPIKFPKTSENEVDFLYEIEEPDNSKWILHIEFQSKNDPQMLERMQEYHSKIYKKFKLPVKPLVINLGQQKFTARTQLKPEEIFTGYQLINVYELSADELLQDQIPEVVVLALLANYKAEQIESVLRLIVQQLKRIVTTEKDLTRYINQLLILSRLRNFETETEIILDNMPVTYDIEKDGLFLKGVKRGEKQGIEKGIEKGLIKTILFCDKIGMSPNEIAKEFEIDIAKVLQALEEHKHLD